MKKLALLVALLAASNLIAQGKHDVVLTWNASTGADGYNIYRGAQSGGPYSLIDTTALLTYTDPLVPPSNYWYTVTAYNSTGESGYSNEVPVTMLQLGGTSSVFYGNAIVLTGDPNANQPSDYTNPIQPPIGNGVSVNGHRAGNAKADTSWGTPVWKAQDFGVIGTGGWGWDITTDEKHRWAFVTITNPDTTNYVRSNVVSLWDNSLQCTVGYMRPGGPGYRDFVRDPVTGTGYVVNSVLTVSTGLFPTDKSMTGTDITINGVVYQIASDNGSVVLAQSGVNVGSSGSPVAFSGGWNDQDVVYGLYPPSQVARVNIRVCAAIAPSKVTSPTDPSWETYDTINGGTGYVGANLFQNGFLCGGALSELNDDGNSFCISDNTNGTGNTYDPRLYTLVSKNAGTWSNAIPRYAWQTLTALNCTSGTQVCTIATSGSPNYKLGASLQIENANITGSGGASSARGLKYMTCAVSVVTDASHYTVNGCPTQSTTVSETSGYVNQQLRSTLVVPQVDNFPTIGAGVGKTYLFGVENDIANGGPALLTVWDVSSGTPTNVKDLTNDWGHNTFYPYNGDLFLTQYAGKTVNTASGNQTMAGCSSSIFTWNARTDAMVCLFPNSMDTTEEYYSSSTPARRGNPHPYIIITQLDDHWLTSYTSAVKYTFATRPATGNFIITDALVAGDCGAGGGTNIAFCSWDAGASAYIPVNTYSIPLQTGTVTVGGTPYNFDWTQRWGYLTPNTTSVNARPRYLTNEVLVYDLVGAQGYHLLHHYTRSINPKYLNANDFNVLPHVSCSRDGYICGVDSSYGSNLNVAGYAFQVLKDTTTSVTVSPSAASIPTLGTQQFTASPSGGTWTLSVGCASAINSAGFLTATATAETCTVTNTQGLNSGTATINISALSVTPSTSALTVGGTQQFTSNFPATWSATGGTISSSGLYTAPSTNGTYTITATAVNGGSTATATATVTGEQTLIPLSISPTSWTQQTTISTTITKAFTATNIGTGTVTPAVTLTGSGKFSISANTCTGTVSGGGNCTVTIQFLSSTVGTFSGNLNISDTAGGNQNLPLSVSIPTGNTVIISPLSVTLPTNGHQQFSASTSNGSGVTWTTTCSTGTVNSSGFFTDTGSETCTVTATASDASGANGIASVTVITFAVSPVAVTIQAGAQQQFVANFPATFAVTSGACTSTSSGLLTAPGTTGSCVLTATASNGGAVATASISVVPAPSTTPGGSMKGGNGKWKVFH